MKKLNNDLGKIPLIGVIYPYRVQESGYEVDIMSNKVGMIYGILGTYNECTKSVFDLNEEEELFNKYLEEYDLLIIPGGVKRKRIKTRTIEF